MAASTVEKVSPTEAKFILDDTMRAVKAMKASWLHVAINLKKIRNDELWRFAKPQVVSYDSYVLDVLKLNKYVAARMLRAMEYSEEKRPGFVEDFESNPGRDVPSFDVVDQLRRVEDRFVDRPSDFGDLEKSVFDEGVGRTILKRRIEEKLTPAVSSYEEEPEEKEEPDSPEKVLSDLKVIERRMFKLKEIPEEAREKMYELVSIIAQHSD
ncbi:MAG: hypothetical protein NUW37_18620 [Planctomycetes bacterium]|nr:hypothetical protein [Planctomycetota bacterium]